MKEVLINGVLFAHYEVKGEHIFLKMIIKIFPQNETLSEDCLAKIISVIEEKNFKFIHFLNK